MLSMVTSTRPSQATCFSYFTLNKKSLLVSTICCVSTVAEAPISHSTSISSFNININSPVDANSSRRSGNYKPTTWDFEYIQSIKNDYVGEEYMERLNKLKKEMQKMLLMMVVEDHEELDQLKLIDNLQRLGVSYHFKEEIMQILRSSHHKSTINADNSLYSTALKFRLLREHGFDISQDILKNFKDEDGNLKESTYNDTNGLLELYEASFFSTETDTTLKNATSLTVSHLKKYLDDDNNNHEENNEVMVDLVQHALELPRHWMMQRLETIWYINIYERMSNPNHLLLELAKLDFNNIQDAHQQELRNLSRWWNSTCLAEKLPFSRDRLVENSFCSVGIIFEPRYSYCRRMLTKVVTFITIIDDIYDVYGTLDELELFTDAIERWEIKAMEQLPNYMKVCYLVLFNTTNEMAYEVLKEQGINIIPYLKKTWSDLCKAYIREARWYNSRYTPTLEEYMDNAWISIGVPLTLVHAFIFVTHPITEEALESISKYPDIIRHSGIIFRLADDLGTSSEELKRGDVPKSIQCYMNEKGATEEEAREGIRLMIKETWELMNKHTRQKDELFSETFIGMALNMLRMSHCFYQHGDGHGIQNSQIIDRISKILLKPISIPL